MVDGLNSFCVFCGSSFGNSPVYAEKVRDLGVLLAERDLLLVYGGSGVGLMGELARTVLEHGGKVVGVIPKAISEKVPHLEVTELHVVETMHERKAKMYSLSDAFIAMPGGIGTLDELFEIYTWSQLGFHSKPVGLYDMKGYFSRLADFLDHAVEEGFLKSAHRNVLLRDADPQRLLGKITSFIANASETPLEGKWRIEDGSA